MTPQRAKVRVEIGTDCIRVISARVQYASDGIRYRVHLSPAEINGKREIGSRQLNFISHRLYQRTKPQLSFKECRNAIVEASSGNDKPLYELLESSNIADADMVFNVAPPKRLDSLTNLLQYP